MPWIKLAKLRAELISYGCLHIRHRACPKRSFTVHGEVPLEGKAISKFMNQNSVFSSFVKETHFLALEKPCALVIPLQHILRVSKVTPSEVTVPWWRKMRHNPIHRQQHLPSVQWAPMSWQHRFFLVYLNSNICNNGRGHSVISQALIEKLLGAHHGARCWGFRCDLNKISAFMCLHFHSINTSHSR